MDVLHTTEVMAIFVIFLSIFAKIWLPWQRPLGPCLLCMGVSRMNFPMAQTLSQNQTLHGYVAYN